MTAALYNVAGSLSGTLPAGRVAKRDVERKEPARAGRFRDEYDQLTQATEAEHAEAVRSLKDNSQEETREDRREHGGAEPPREEASEPAVYSPDRGVIRPVHRPQPRLDLEG